MKIKIYFFVATTVPQNSSESPWVSKKPDETKRLKKSGHGQLLKQKLGGDFSSYWLLRKKKSKSPGVFVSAGCFFGKGRTNL